MFRRESVPQSISVLALAVFAKPIRKQLSWAYWSVTVALAPLLSDDVSLERHAVNPVERNDYSSLNGAVFTILPVISGCRKLARLCNLTVAGPSDTGICKVKSGCHTCGVCHRA